MKKGILRQLILLIIVLVLGGGICHIYSKLTKEPISQPLSENLSQYGVHNYKIQGEFDDEKKLLKVNQEVTYKNAHNIDFDTIYFHLYPNAFKEKEKVPFFKEEFNKAYPKGFKPGYIDIEEVRIGDTSVSYKIGGQEGTILSIKLPKPLKAKEEILISFNYTLKLPPSSSRFGYGENTYNFGNWYPIGAIYDEKDWKLHPYHKIGDPFYSEVSNYQISLILPEEFELATTGVIKKSKKIKNKQTGQREKLWNIEAKGVRDFAWVTSKDFKIKKGEVDGIDIKIFYLKDQKADKALEVAKDSIKIFNKLFCKYPYEEFSVVACDFFIGGMEYPNLVYIDQETFSQENTFILEYIIAHETAHQWWYGIIGNDQVIEPWLDEALTEYSTMLYYREKYGEDTMIKVLKTMVVDDYVRGRIELENKDEGIGRGVEEFKNNRDYSAIVYSKGAMMFFELEKEVGREDFQRILKYYIKENKFQNVNQKDIMAITKVVTGKDHKEFFYKWLGMANH